MNIALLLSGGTGSRLASAVPKQYVSVHGRMIVSRSLETLLVHPLIDALQIVAAKEWQEKIKGELTEAGRRKLKGFSLPGENRQLSILNGLRDINGYAQETDLVLIHDAARPCVSGELITAVLSAAADHDGAVPVLPLKDTVYSSEDGKRLSGLLERAKILAGQAPEAFLLGKYLEACEALSPEAILRISGSAEPALLAGMDIAALPGDEGNFKLTTNQDMERYIRIVSERRTK